MPELPPKGPFKRVTGPLWRQFGRVASFVPLCRRTLAGWPNIYPACVMRKASSSSPTSLCLRRRFFVRRPALWCTSWSFPLHIPVNRHLNWPSQVIFCKWAGSGTASLENSIRLWTDPGLQSATYIQHGQQRPKRVTLCRFTRYSELKDLCTAHSQRCEPACCCLADLFMEARLFDLLRFTTRIRLCPIRRHAVAKASASKIWGLSDWQY